MLWFNIILITILIAISIEDIIKREVPDYLVYVLLALSFIYFLIFTQHTLMQFISIAIISAMGIAFYFSGLWSMGDMFTIISAILIVPNLFYFVLVTFSFSAVFMILYVLIYGAIKNVFDINGKKIIKAILLILISVLTYIYLSQLSILIPSVLAILLFILFFQEIEKFQEKAYYIAKPEELVEGDWIIDPVIVDKKVIVPLRKTGLTKEDIEKIKQHKINVKVKRGIPLIPGLVIAPILYLI